MQKWNKEGIPHKGWTFVEMEDLGEGVFGEDIPYEKCEMCGNEHIRYVHIMKHPEYDLLRVGCKCAAKMEDDYVNPKRREQDLKNRAKRRQNFLKHDWVHSSFPGRGEYFINYRGKFIDLRKSKYGSYFGVYYCGKSIWYFKGRRIVDLNTAKLAAFNLFDDYCKKS